MNQRGCDRWDRGPDDISVRVEAEDVRRQLGKRPFVVYEGTTALCFVQGHLAGEMPPGRYDIDGPFRKWFTRDDPTTLVLVDSGRIVVDIDVPKLHTAERHTLVAALRIVIAVGNAEAFYRNTMKGMARFSKRDLRDLVMPGLASALLSVASTKTVDELQSSAALRADLQHAAGASLTATLSEGGFQVVSTEITGLSCPELGSLYEGEASLDRDRRSASLEQLRLEVAKQFREIEAAEAQHRAHTDAATEVILQQILNDVRIKGHLLDTEFGQLQAQSRQDAEDYLRSRARQRELQDLSHGHTLDMARAEHRRQETDLDYQQAARIRDDALKARKEKELQDIEILKAKSGVIGGMDTETKLAMGYGDKDALLEIMKLQSQRGLSEGALLIIVARDNPHMAEVLARKYETDGKVNATLIEELQKQVERERERGSEEGNRTAQLLESIAGAWAKAQGPGDQVIVPGVGIIGADRAHDRRADQESS